MTHLAWRQLRLPALTAGALVAVALITMLVTGRQMTGYAANSGLTSCLTAHSDCSIALNAFESRFGIWLTLLGGLTFLPMLAGLFLGAPLVAREFEQGTHRLVWTQSISRGRWIGTKLAMVVAGLVVVGSAITIGFTLWAHTWSTVDVSGHSRIQPTMFSLQGTVPIATLLAAFAIGLFASVFTRRTLPAMAVALTGFIAISLGLRLAAPMLVRPQTLTFPFGAYSPRRGLGDWLLSEDVIDRAGNSISQANLQTLCPATNPTGGLRGIDPRCVTAHGYQFHTTFEPLSAFWRLQTTETAILAVLSIILIALATWKITRHTS